MSKRNSVFSLLIIVVLLSVISCDNQSSFSNERMVVEADESRVHLTDEVIELNGPGRDPINYNFELVLRAEVDAPEYLGYTLRATHVKIVGNYAIVSYNYEDETFVGGVDIFNVAMPENPYLVSSALFSDTDVSSVDYVDGHLYLADHIQESSWETFELSSGAALEKINSSTWSNEIIDLPSYAATGIDVHNDKVYITTGDGPEGGLSVYNKDDLTFINSVNFEDARYVEASDSYIATMQGTPATIKFYAVDTLEEIIEIEVGGANIEESKSTFEIDGDFAYVATGSEGMKVIDLASQQIIDTIPIEVPDGAEPTDYVTNAVTVNNDLIFVANGTAGISVLDWADYTNLRELGSMEFDSSSNFVEAQDNVIFVATGFGGLKILEVCYYVCEYATMGTWDDNGNPDYLYEIVEVDDSVIDDIHTYLPANQSVWENHPEYIDDVETNLIIGEESEVFLTFLYEGAGWKNSLGYYYYDLNNPPQTLDEIDTKIVAFPNTSLPGSGGNLEQGSTIQLEMMDGTTNFPANTAIGFFLIARGWDPVDATVTNGVYKHFSNYDLNEAE
ncbi:MAG: hypothetical protein U9N34_01955, partial [Candidatus Cloacimonadota bacterium]|nr:hypothetical protein [Candidatus Cloacimonadota bacterium]